MYMHFTVPSLITYVIHPFHVSARLGKKNPMLIKVAGFLCKIHKEARFSGVRIVMSLFELIKFISESFKSFLVFGEGGMEDF